MQRSTLKNTTQQELFNQWFCLPSADRTHLPNAYKWRVAWPLFC